MKRVLVTGANGFIGRHTLPLMKKKGYEIYAISCNTPPVLEKGIHWIQHNLLTDPAQELIQKIKPSELLHFSWVTSPGKLWDSRENLDWIRASFDLVESFLQEGGRRAVFAGTCAEYDWTSKEFSENRTPCIPSTLYGSSKYALYLLVHALQKKYNFSYAWGRIFYLYGPHEHFRRFIPVIIQGILQKNPVPCSSCTQIKDLLYVKDVARAFVDLLDSEVQGAINIGSGSGIQLLEVIEKVTDRLGGKELIQIGSMPVVQHESPSLIADTTRLKSELQWSPFYSIEDGLEDTIAWWKGRL